MAENSAALFSLIGQHGAHGLENPQDPGIPPYPSAWLLEEIRSYTSQVWCSAVDVDLCRFDWISRKPTSIRGQPRSWAASLTARSVPHRRSDTPPRSAPLSRSAWSSATRMSLPVAIEAFRAAVWAWLEDRLTPSVQTRYAAARLAFHDWCSTAGIDDAELPADQLDIVAARFLLVAKEDDDSLLCR